MASKKLLWIFAGIFIASFLGFLGYHGLLQKIHVIEAPCGPYFVAYKKVTGPYGQTGERMTEVVQHLLEQKMTPLQGFGMYFDNPKQVKGDSQRSIVGAVIDPAQSAGLASSGLGLSIKEFPSQTCVQTSFPFKSQMSVYMGIMRAYPVIFRYLEEHGILMNVLIEVYDQKQQEILYLIPQDKSLNYADLYFN